jgi:hypothetical protein
VLNKSENERSGVLSTAMSFLGLYRDPTVAATTAACDWRITDLVDADRPVSLYLVIPPSDISRTKPLVRLILNQIGRRLTERLSASAIPDCPKRMSPNRTPSVRLVSASMTGPTPLRTPRSWIGRAVSALSAGPTPSTKASRSAIPAATSCRNSKGGMP